MREKKGYLEIKGESIEQWLRVLFFRFDYVDFKFSLVINSIIRGKLFNL